MSPSSLSVFSPCKFNLFLAVGNVRPDGYHEVITVMEPLNLCDRIHFEQISTKQIEVISNDPRVPSGHDNLVYQAADRFRREAGIDFGVRIVLEKNIPSSAGLGGGSGDAATTLKALEQLWEVSLPQDCLRKICAQLGSDVAFFLEPRTSLCRGRGEQVEFLPKAPEVHAILVNPGLPLPTAWAYEQLDLDSSPSFPELQPLLDALKARDWDQIAPCLYNAFEPLACRCYPEVAAIIDFLRCRLDLGAILSGSGATVVGLANSEDEINAVAEQARLFFPDIFVATATNRPPSDKCH